MLWRVGGRRGEDNQRECASHVPVVRVKKCDGCLKVRVEKCAICPKVRVEKCVKYLKVRVKKCIFASEYVI